MGFRTVQVIKLISKDSIEDCMLQLGQKKLKLEQDMTAAEQGKKPCTHTVVFLTACTPLLYKYMKLTEFSSNLSFKNQQKEQG